MDRHRQRRMSEAVSEAHAGTDGGMLSDFVDVVGGGDAGSTVLAGVQAHTEGLDDIDPFYRILVSAVGAMHPLDDHDGGGYARIMCAFLDESSGAPGSLVRNGLGGCEAAAGSLVAAPAA